MAVVDRRSADRSGGSGGLPVREGGSGASRRPSAICVPPPFPPDSSTSATTGGPGADGSSSWPWAWYSAQRLPAPSSGRPIPCRSRSAPGPRSRSWVYRTGRAWYRHRSFSWGGLATPAGFVLIVGGGFLVGFGARYADGCTSGHAISGLANLQLLVSGGCRRILRGRSHRDACSSAADPLTDDRADVEPTRTRVAVPPAGRLPGRRLSQDRADFLVQDPGDVPLSRLPHVRDHRWRGGAVARWRGGAVARLRWGRWVSF